MHYGQFFLVKSGWTGFSWGLVEKFNGRREEGVMVVIGSVSSEQNRKLEEEGGKAEVIHNSWLPIGCSEFEQPIGKQEVREEESRSNGEDLKIVYEEVPFWAGGSKTRLFENLSRDH